jgi:hypothetical membrane protein
VREEPPDSTAAKHAALAGIIGPVAFNVVVEIESLLRPGYDSSRQFISDLSLGGNGLTQNLNFIFFGGSVGILAWSIREGLARDLRAKLGAAMVTLAGAGLILAGVFDVDPLPEVALTVGGEIHLAAAMLVFGGTAIAALLLAPMLSRAPGSRGLALYSRCAAMVCIGGTVAPVFFFGPFDRSWVASISHIAGALQRVGETVFCILFIWVEIAIRRRR